MTGVPNVPDVTFKDSRTPEEIREQAQRTAQFDSLAQALADGHARSNQTGGNKNG